ncbi:hypothetical protein BDV11DRAFT_179549 [Aspergillus similis]
MNPNSLQTTMSVLIIVVNYLPGLSWPFRILGLVAFQFPLKVPPKYELLPYRMG